MEITLCRGKFLCRAATTITVVGEGIYISALHLDDERAIEKLLKKISKIKSRREVRSYTI